VENAREFVAAGQSARVSAHPPARGREGRAQAVQTP
jgi:hypothetical protein